MKQKVMVVNGSNFGQILAVMDAIFSIVPQRALKTWIIENFTAAMIAHKVKYTSRIFFLSGKNMLPYHFSIENKSPQSFQ